MPKASNGNDNGTKITIYSIYINTMPRNAEDVIGHPETLKKQF